jgi:hypothetical protein
MRKFFETLKRIGTRFVFKWALVFLLVPTFIGGLLVSMIQIGNSSYTSAYGNSMLLTDPQALCSGSKLQDIYYTTLQGGAVYSGYITPLRVRFCEEPKFIVEGIFKDFYGEEVCFGDFVAVIGESELYAVFAPHNSSNKGCRQTSIRLWKNMKLYEKLCFFMTKLFTIAP